MLGEEAAEQRTRHVGDAEDDAEVAHVLAPLPGRHDVAHDGLGPDHQPAGPDPLDRPEGDELGHGLGQPGQHGADQEDHDGQLEERFAAVEVAQLSPQRRGDAGGQQVGRHHPRQVVEPVQVAGDGGECRRHDGLVEGGQGHPHHESAEDHQDPAVLGAGGLFIDRGRRQLSHGRRPGLARGPPRND